MFGLVLLQNASFTLVGRARNSNSLIFHGIASLISNGIWVIVIRQVVLNFDNTQMMIAYGVGGVSGGVLMHYISMNFIETKIKSS